VTIGIEGDGERTGSGSFLEVIEWCAVRLSKLAGGDQVPESLAEDDEPLAVTLGSHAPVEGQVAGAEPRLDAGKGGEFVRSCLDVGRIEERADEFQPTRRRLAPTRSLGRQRSIVTVCA